MDERNKKLAEWAGIKVLGISPANEPSDSLWGEIDMTGFALYPGETRARSLCDFPNDLNACFKWLVPKLIANDRWLRLEVISGDMECEAEIRDWNGHLHHTSGDVETAPLALCKAIERMVDNGS